jgi:hypothetical protein
VIDKLNETLEIEIPYGVHEKNAVRCILSNIEMMEYSGSLKDFIAQAGKPQAVQFCKKGEYKDHLVELDLKSAYAAAMRTAKNYNGIPKDFMGIIPKDSVMFIVEARLLKINSDTNPWIKKRYKIHETYILDKIEYDYLTIKQNAEFEVIRGVEFTEQKSNFQRDVKQILKLWETEKDIVYKNIRRLIHGILLERLKPKKYYCESQVVLDKILYKHHGQILSQRKLPGTEIVCVKVKRRINNQFRNSLLGVNIRSIARIRMYRILDRCHESNIDVYRSHTDSLIIKHSGKNKLANFIGDSPGQLVQKKEFKKGVNIIHMNKLITL